MLYIYHRQDPLVVLFRRIIFTPFLYAVRDIIPVNSMMNCQFRFIFIRRHIIKKTGFYIENAKKVIAVIHNCLYHTLTDMTAIHIMDIEKCHHIAGSSILSEFGGKTYPSVGSILHPALALRYSAVLTFLIEIQQLLCGKNRLYLFPGGLQSTLLYNTVQQFLIGMYFFQLQLVIYGRTDNFFI